MFDVRKPKQQQKNWSPIRTASKIELENFERRKISTVDTKARVKAEPVEVVECLDTANIASIRINGNKLRVEPYSNEVKIDLGNLAFKSAISPAELSKDEFFFINCELDENVLK